MNIELTDDERDRFYDLIVDHPMWKHDGVELEYDPEREGLIGMFLDSEAHIVASIAAAKVAAALREAAENVFVDESLEGRTAMVRTNEAWRLLLKTLAKEYDAPAKETV